MELRHAIAYVNDAVVPQVRRESSWPCAVFPIRCAMWPIVSTANIHPRAHKPDDHARRPEGRSRNGIRGPGRASHPGRSSGRLPSPQNREPDSADRTSGRGNLSRIAAHSATVSQRFQSASVAHSSHAPAPRRRERRRHSLREYPPPLLTEVGLATWYTAPYKGRRSANGEVFDDTAMTAAHRTLPMGSLIVVTNLKTGQSTAMRISNRGPFVEGRVVDLTVASAKATGVTALESFASGSMSPDPQAHRHGGRWCVQIGAFHGERRPSSSSRSF